ncbi:MAG TPA: hypothetical protein PKB10_14790, partial [Tepidisphaeraceae bacterium]|nr:hypothetical protein [Tepidisphaeraceae bacterium]
VEIFSGALRVTSNNALGASSGGTVLKGGTNTGVLELAGGITLAEPITLEARSSDFPTHLANVSGNNTLSANLRTLWGGLGYAIASDAGTLTLAGDVFYGDVQTYDRPLYFRGEGAGVINGVVRGNSGWDHNLFKTGGGTWTLMGGVAPSGAASVATADVNVAGGLLVVRDRLPRGAINIDAGTLRLAGTGAGPSMTSATVTALNVTGSGRLDLADQFLVVDYTGSSPISAIESLLRTGRAGGAWNGTG